MAAKTGDGRCQEDPDSICFRENHDYPEGKAGRKPGPTLVAFPLPDFFYKVERNPFSFSSQITLQDKREPSSVKVGEYGGHLNEKEELWALRVPKGSSDLTFQDSEATFRRDCGTAIGDL